MRKVLQWNEYLETKGLRVNISITKVMVYVVPVTITFRIRIGIVFVAPCKTHPSKILFFHNNHIISHWYIIIYYCLLIKCKMFCS